MPYGLPWKWYWGRRGRRGRRPKPRIIDFRLTRIFFAPIDIDGRVIEGEPIHIMPDELEAMRLVYLLGYNQEEAAKKMGVSRGTLWRMLNSGRRKLVQAIVESRPILISP